MDSRVHLGSRVRVHVNLHKNQLAVVDPRKGLVIAYVTDIVLTGVEFRHQPACVQRIKDTGVRKVCAYAIGCVEAVNTNPGITGRLVRYNPHLRPDFHDAITQETITHADRVLFTHLRAYAID